MTAIFTVRDANNQVIDSHQTPFIRTADLIARALAFQYPGCEIETEFKSA